MADGNCPATGAPCALRSDEELKVLGREVAFATLREVGVMVETDDVQTITDARADLSFLRRLRSQADQASSIVFKAILTATSTFVLGALAIGVKLSLK